MFSYNVNRIVIYKSSYHWKVISLLNASCIFHLYCSGFLLLMLQSSVNGKNENDWWKQDARMSNAMRESIDIFFKQIETRGKCQGGLSWEEIQSEVTFSIGWALTSGVLESSSDFEIVLHHAHKNLHRFSLLLILHMPTSQDLHLSELYKMPRRTRYMLLCSCHITWAFIYLSYETHPYIRLFLCGRQVKSPLIHFLPSLFSSAIVVVWCSVPL